MKLFGYAGSANVYKQDLVIAQLGLAVERVEIDIFAGEGQTPAFLARNPSGRVPVLELDDGEIIVESNAILWHLARGSRLLPEAPLAQTRVISWLCFEQNEIEPVIGSARYWKLTGRGRDREDELARRTAQGARSLATLDGVLASRRWLVGDAYSIADIAVYAYAHLAGDLGIELGASLRAWIARVEAEPAWRPGPAMYGANAMV